MKILTNKEQQKVCNAIVANTIIAFSLLDLEDLDPKRTIDYTEHLIGNAVDSLYLVGGMKAVFEGQKEICNVISRKGRRENDGL